MPTFHLHNFGCRASQADGAALKRQLLEMGLEEVASPERSHLAVLNTCTVTASADAEVRQVIRRIHRLNPHCRILVTGCYAQRAPAEIAEFPGVAWVVGNSHKHAVVELLKETIDRGGYETHPYDKPPAGTSGLVQIHEAGAAPPPHGVSNLAAIKAEQAGRPYRAGSEVFLEETEAQVLVGDIPDVFHFAPAYPDDRTRPTLKVQDGCAARCSFCIIPTVRGPSRSLAPEIVLDQVRRLVEAGYQEIVLSGINLGCYGKDLDRRITFLGLLERILDETSIARVRISSIEPMDVGPELVRLEAREPRLAQHFHIPLQSGCDRILRLMNRRYWAAQYAERLLAIREQIPNCGIGADVMVGFPGETEQDHATSVRFIESLPFTYLHIFPYSARPSTRAAAMLEQVNGRVARERSEDLRTLIGAKRQAFLSAQVGRTLSVLTLDETEGGSRRALSSNYLKVILPGSAVSRNTLLDVRVGRVQGELLYGYPESEPSPRPAEFTFDLERCYPRGEQRPD